MLPGHVLRVLEHYGFRPCQLDGEAMRLSFLRPIRSQDQVNTDLMPGALFQDFVMPPSPGGPEEDAELLGVVPSEEFCAIVGACLQKIPPPHSENDRADIETAVLDLLMLVPAGKPSAEYTARDHKAVSSDIARIALGARALPGPHEVEALKTGPDPCFGAGLSEGY